MNNSVIIGYGMVGKATAHAFGIEDYVSRSNSTISWGQAAGRKYIFLCLPTPTVHGVCDTSALEQTIQTISRGRKNNRPIIIIRSTVYPGFADKMRAQYPGIGFVSNPEFLTEKTSFHDAVNPEFVVIGSHDISDAEKVTALYNSRLKGVDIMVTDNITAELLKLAMNTFFVTKIVFANEIYDYARKVGANYEVIKKALIKHPWGSKNHFTIYHQGGKGGAGACLPKDLEAFTEVSGSEFLKKVQEINTRLVKESEKK